VGIRSRRVALLVADGADGDAAAHVHESLVAEGAVPRFVGVKMGQVHSETGQPIEVEVSLEAAPSVLWDAAVFLEGQTLSACGQALEFLKDQYRHCKPILLLGSATVLLDKAGIPSELPSGDPDPGLMRVEDSDLDVAMAEFVAALTQHRQFNRETDPPLV
jgi:catalase